MLEWSQPFFPDSCWGDHSFEREVSIGVVSKEGGGSQKTNQSKGVDLVTDKVFYRSYRLNLIRSSAAEWYRVLDADR